LLAEKTHPTSGAHERHLASGAVAQQLTLAIGTLTMLAVVTVLGRSLSLSEFGVYGLLVSIPGYMLIAQSSVEIAAIRAMAQADGQESRDRALTTALALYACFGLVAALGIVLVGWALLGVFDISTALRSDARLGLGLLGLINLAGWPAKTAQDVLRGSQRFVSAALAEAVGYVTFGAAMAAAILLGAPLWAIAGLGGSLPLLIGMAAIVILQRLRLPYRVRPSTFSLHYSRAFLSISGYLFVTGIADLVIYSFDRAILGAFRPVSSVGLYEGPIRAHNLIRQLQGTLALTVMPAAAGYVASGDHVRLRDLLVRGTRYVMLVTVPLTVTLMVLSGPILHVWLGPRFAPAAPAMTILVSYWLVGASSSVGGSMLIAVGRTRLVAIFISCVAALSLALSLALTPPLGLNGVVLGTSIPNLLLAPVIIRVYCQTFDVPVRSLLREAFMPAYASAAALALIELGGRLLLGANRVPMLLAIVAVALGIYTAIVYRLCLRPRERMLIRNVLSGARRFIAPGRPSYRAL
jgi:O-antigen/teichoic acid export membrane protein